MARFMNRTERAMAPVRLKSLTKKSYSSKVMPMAAKTTANSASEPSTLAWRAICEATFAWGSPAPEKMGSFCPLTKGFMASMEEMPVWMKSEG